MFGEQVTLRVVGATEVKYSPILWNHLRQVVVRTPAVAAHVVVAVYFGGGIAFHHALPFLVGYQRTYVMRIVRSDGVVNHFDVYAFHYKFLP